MHSQPPVDPDKPVNEDYQDNDINQQVVTRFIVISFVVTIVVFVLMLALFKGLKGHFQSERGVAEASERQIPAKEDSLLQTLPLKDLAEYYDLEHGRLSADTNVIGDAKAIPIEMAMKLMVKEHAFEVGAETEGGENVPTAETTSEPEEAPVEEAPVVEPAAEPAAPKVVAPVEPTVVETAPDAEASVETTADAKPPVEKDPFDKPEAGQAAEEQTVAERVAEILASSEDAATEGEAPAADKAHDHDGHDHGDHAH